MSVLKRMPKSLSMDAMFVTYVMHYYYLEDILVNGKGRMSDMEANKHQFAHVGSMIKARAISDGCFYTLFKGRMGDLLVSCHHLYESYIKQHGPVFELADKMAFEIMVGERKAESNIDNKLDNELVHQNYMQIMERYEESVANAEVVKDTSSEERAIQHLVEGGLSHADAVHAIEQVKSGIDPTDVFNDLNLETNNDIIIEDALEPDIDVDAFLEGLGLQ